MPFWYHKTDSLKWLTGSIREDLIPDERSVWADFMAMASLTREPRRGYIERSEGMPYNKDYFLNFLNITEELLDRTIKKCVAEGRLQVMPDGTLYLTNYSNYNDTTDYVAKREMQKVARAEAKETKRRTSVTLDALMRSINRLNRGNQDKQRYALTGDQRVLDTTTGKILTLAELEKVEDDNS